MYPFRNKVGFTLIGAPGAGKSTLTRLITPSLRGYKSHDHDDNGLEIELQNRGFIDIADAVKKLGDKSFLNFEKQFTLDNYGKSSENKKYSLDNILLASSGSLVRSESAMKHIRERTHVILLDIPIDIVIRQIESRPGGAGRIIGMNGGPNGEIPIHSTLRDELSYRNELYQENHDFKLSHNKGESIYETTNRLYNLITVIRNSAQILIEEVQ